MRAIIKFLSSLRLTVVLLAFSLALIFFGTLEQVQFGIWHTQRLYFESLFVVWSYPPHIAFGEALHWIRIPLPGGYLLGGLLLVNLLAAHITRFKLRWKKLGLFLIHAGLILLLVGELLTDIVATESMLEVDEGGSANYSFNSRSNELVFVDRSHPEYDRVHDIPVDLLTPGAVIDVPQTDLEIRVLNYFPNADILVLAPNGEQPERTANRGVAATMNLFAAPKNITYDDKEANVATAYIEVYYRGESLGVWLVTNVIDERYPPQIVSTPDGQSFEIALRFKRHYYPFEVSLIDFSHEKYPGTDTPFNFSSEVRVRHQDQTRDRKALIYMNHPLRYEGYTFYQASFASQDKTSILQVVKNPGWLLPYISVALMFLGMCLQFGMHFVKFLRKQSAKGSR